MLRLGVILRIVMQQAAGHGSYYAFFTSRINTMGKAFGEYEREGASDQLQLLIIKVACICTCELDRLLLLLTACFWTGPDEGKCSAVVSGQSSMYRQGLQCH